MIEEDKNSLENKEEAQNEDLKFTPDLGITEKLKEKFSFNPKK